jgi:hypothetical protein
VSRRGLYKLPRAPRGFKKAAEPRPLGAGAGESEGRGRGRGGERREGQNVHSGAGGFLLYFFCSGTRPPQHGSGVPQDPLSWSQVPTAELRPRTPSEPKIKAWDSSGLCALSPSSLSLAPGLSLNPPGGTLQVGTACPLR